MKDLSKVREGIIARKRFLEDVYNDIMDNEASPEVMEHAKKYVDFTLDRSDLNPEFDGNYIFTDNFEGLEAYLPIEGVEYDEETGEVVFEEIRYPNIIFNPKGMNASDMLDSYTPVESLSDEELEEIFDDPSCWYPAEYYLKPFTDVYEPYKK